MALIVRLINLILNLFKKRETAPGPQTTPAPETIPAAGRRGLVLTHPEEPQNTAQTVANTPVGDVLNQWLQIYQVPPASRDFWKAKIDIQVYDAWPADKLAMGIRPDTPAFTWETSGSRHLACLASWLNPGVIAHEQAHNSYALLTEVEKAAFAAVYKPLKKTDPLIVFLYRQNPYGLTNDIEGHAELYRYLAERIPAVLQKFYPRLLEAQII